MRGPSLRGPHSWFPAQTTKTVAPRTQLVAQLVARALRYAALTLRFPRNGSHGAELIARLVTRTLIAQPSLLVSHTNDQNGRPADPVRREARCAGAPLCGPHSSFPTQMAKMVPAEPSTLWLIARILVVPSLRGRSLRRPSLRWPSLRGPSSRGPSLRGPSLWALVVRALVERTLVARALVVRALVARALVARARVARALVAWALAARAFVARALVARALIVWALVVQALVARRVPGAGRDRAAAGAGAGAGAGALPFICIYCIAFRCLSLPFTAFHCLS